MEVFYNCYWGKVGVYVEVMRKVFGEVGDVVVEVLEGCGFGGWIVVFVVSWVMLVFN